MKKTIIALAALAVGASAYAQDTAKTSELAVTLDVTYVSDYIFRGVKLADDSIQPSIEAAYGDFYAGLWHSNDINSSAGASETDLYAGYGLAINETFSADFGVTRYTYQGSGSSALNTTEVYVGVSADVLLSPSVYYYHDFDLEVNTYIASIGHSFAISSVGLSVDTSATYGWVQAPKSTGGDYSYWGVGAAVPYALSETATLTAAVNYTHIDRANFEPTQDRVVFSLGVAVGF
jgi:uncharacterized protein (TIGR02001 family)